MSAVEQFRALSASLMTGNASIKDVLSILTPPGHSQDHFQRLYRASTPIVFVVAKAGAWTRDFSQFAVSVSFGIPMGLTVTLPDFFRSVERAIALRDSTGRTSVFDLARFRDVLALVLDMLILCEIDLVVSVLAAKRSLSTGLDLVVSYEDACTRMQTATLSRIKGSHEILIPNPPYFHTSAYSQQKINVLQQRRRWRDRVDRIIWRGSTTGAPFDSSDVLQNERIRLAAACARRPDLFDVKITNVVQTADDDVANVRRQLEDLGLFAPWEHISKFVDHKFVLHIDGNASAFGLFEVLSLGCCVLRVESRFEQWFEPRLEPWRHYVPVAADLSNLVEVAEFVVARPDFAERIAREGFEFALAADYHTEARHFIRQLAGAPAPQPLMGEPDRRASRGLVRRAVSPILRAARRISAPKTPSKASVSNRVSTSLSKLTALTGLWW